MSVEFLLTTLIVVVIPGTGAIYTMAAGLARGARASILAAFACTLGILPHILAAITGVAALLHASAVGFQTLKYLGVAYLFYMAWTMVRERGGVFAEKEVAPRSNSRVVLTGITINLLNPKLTIFFFAFLPQFVPTTSLHATRQMLELSGIFMATTFVVFCLYGILAAGVRKQIVSRPKMMSWIQRGFAGAFVALGMRLALTDR